MHSGVTARVGVRFEGSRVCADAGVADSDLFGGPLCREAPSEPMSTPPQGDIDLVGQFLNRLFSGAQGARLDPGTVLGLRELFRHYTNGLLTADEQSTFVTIARDAVLGWYGQMQQAALRAVESGAAEAYARTTGACCVTCAHGFPCPGGDE